MVDIHLTTHLWNNEIAKTLILPLSNKSISESYRKWVIILMYFMYKIYKNESEFIENILFD